MRFASLGSGSKGNATVVCNGRTRILVDCGFSLRELETRIARLGITVADLNGVLVTHEHSDHMRGVGPTARKYGIPVYMTPGTYRSRNFGELPNLQLIQQYQPFELGDIQVQPVAVAHDAQEPSQYIFHCVGLKLGILTDLGSITTEVLTAYQGCDGLLIEANHDPVMLACGPYPQSLKARVAGRWGHLSNAQTASLLAQLDTSRLQQLVVGHISQQNNSLEHTSAALAGVISHIDIQYACQNQGFDWLQLK